MSDQHPAIRGFYDKLARTLPDRDGREPSYTDVEIWLNQLPRREGSSIRSLFKDIVDSFNKRRTPPKVKLVLRRARDCQKVGPRVWDDVVSGKYAIELRRNHLTRYRKVQEVKAELAAKKARARGAMTASVHGRRELGRGILPAQGQTLRTGSHRNNH